MFNNAAPRSTYVIAEAGVNHNGNLENAYALIDAAAESGADAVKFQTFKAELLATTSAIKADYQTKSGVPGESQLEMLARLELPLEWHRELQNHAHKKGIEFLSTAFDARSLDFLKSLGLPIYKIPSGEITNGPLLWDFAQSGGKLILSTGMSFISEIEQALAILAHGLCRQIRPSSLNEVWEHWTLPEARSAVRANVTLLHCTSQYPTNPVDVNLSAMQTLAHIFQIPVGYSDHTAGTLIPIAAVANGACLVEKHFTLDRGMQGPDHKASLEPDELKKMVDEIRIIEQAMGDGFKIPRQAEWSNRNVSRQSIVFARHVNAGKIIEAEDMTTARAGGGVPACMFWDLIGQPALKTFKQGEVFEL